MTKTAIFTEGQTELIFVRELLLRTADLSKISFECLELRSGQEIPVNYDYPNPGAEAHFFILNIGNDCKVLSAIKDKEAKLLGQGYNRIIGLRDMYGREYKKYSPGKIDDKISAEIVSLTEEQLQDTTNPNKIGFYFAIMEVEAWILAMHNMFQKLDTSLSSEYIEEKLGFNLRDIDPQKEFYKPSDQLLEVCLLMGREYKKKLADVEMLCSKMDEADYLESIENGRCESFNLFFQDIENCLP